MTPTTLDSPVCSSEAIGRRLSQDEFAGPHHAARAAQWGAMAKVAFILMPLAAACPAPAYSVEASSTGSREAFRLSTSMAERRVRLEWRIAKGHFLLPSELRFISDTLGLTFGAPLVPPGEVIQHPTLGAVEVLRDHVIVELPVASDALAPTALTLRVTSMGCADDGECLPPHTERVRVERATALASPLAASAVTQSGSPSVSPVEALSALGAGIGASQSGYEFLPPDAAFVLNLELGEADTIIARWEIADTYYLYRDKFGFALKDTPGVALGEAVFPAGKLKDDPYFGQVEVFYEKAQAAIALVRGERSATEVALDVTYQGCTDLGLCYPPITKTVTLALPAVRTE